MLRLEDVNQLKIFVLKLNFASNVSKLEIDKKLSVGVKEVLSQYLKSINDE